MVSVEEAYQQIINTTTKGESTSIPVAQSAGFVLSKNILAPINLPSFRNSAMDGYAIRVEDYQGKNTTLFVEFEIQAGDTSSYRLSKGAAARIFTGAPLPVNSDAVVMQEHTSRESEKLIVHEEQINAEQNIRQIAEQVSRGDVALKAGTQIRPATIGYLSSLGITEIEVFKKPSVAVLNTGNELIDPGKKLAFGQIYESNSLALLTALQQSGITQMKQFRIPDSFEQTKSIISKALASFDVLLLTGGISVGDYDFVGRALNDLDVKEIFYKVKQKPGKPLYYGRKNKKSAFALPGNPAAALSCFYVYVRPALKIQIGLPAAPLYHSQKNALNSFSKKGSRGQFLKALFKEEGVDILEGQSSNMMHTFALANSLVYLNENESEIQEGDLLNLIII